MSAQFPGSLTTDTQRAAPPAGAVWVPQVFERSGGAAWIWYVVADLRPGRTQGRFPIPVFRELLAAGLATRGDVPGGFSDAVLDRMEAERLTPEERAEKDRQRAANAAAVRRANCTAGEDCRTAGRVVEDMATAAPEVASELGHNVGTLHTHDYGIDACADGFVQRLRHLFDHGTLLLFGAALDHVNLCERHGFSFVVWGPAAAARQPGSCISRR